MLAYEVLLGQGCRKRCALPGRGMPHVKVALPGSVALYVLDPLHTLDGSYFCAPHLLGMRLLRHWLSATPAAIGKRNTVSSC